MSIFGTLPDITRLSERVIRVMGGNPGKVGYHSTPFSALFHLKLCTAQGVEMS